MCDGHSYEEADVLGPSQLSRTVAAVGAAGPTGRLAIDLRPTKTLNDALF
jgi:hypothetical protein